MGHRGLLESGFRSFGMISFTAGMLDFPAGSRYSGNRKGTLSGDSP
jgi:hypothetical protein